MICNWLAYECHWQNTNCIGYRRHDQNINIDSVSCHACSPPSLDVSDFLGNKSAATAEITTVNKIVRVPSEIFEITGKYVAQKLEIKASTINPAMTLSLRAGGMITARNIP